jgi:hypothetical protein
VTETEEQRSAGRAELDLLERVDGAVELLTQTVDSQRQHPPDQMAAAAREALIDLRTPLEKALEALQEIERRRDLTERERDLRHAFEMLLVAGSQCG